VSHPWRERLPHRDLSLRLPFIGELPFRPKVKAGATNAGGIHSDGIGTNMKT
jgi:hypothetical protein